LDCHVALSRIPARGREHGSSNRLVAGQLDGARLSGQPGREVDFRRTLRFQIEGFRSSGSEGSLDAKGRDRDRCSDRPRVGDCEASDTVSVRYGRNHDRGRRGGGSQLPVSAGRHLLEPPQLSSDCSDPARTRPNGDGQWPLGLHERADRDGPTASSGYGDVGTAGHGDPTMATEESQVDDRLRVIRVGQDQLGLVGFTRADAGKPLQGGWWRA
jgi:hypothetical protein